MPNNLNTIKDKKLNRIKNTSHSNNQNLTGFLGKLFTNLFSFSIKGKPALIALSVKYAVGSVTKQETKPVVKSVSETTSVNGVIDIDLLKIQVNTEFKIALLTPEFKT